MALPSPRPSRFPSYPEDTSDTGVRRREVYFLAQSTLDGRLRERKVTIDGSVLTVVANGERLAVRDAMRILGPRGRGVDMFGMTGRILPLADLLNMGASVTIDTVRLGSVEYDIEVGFLVQSIA